MFLCQKKLFSRYVRWLFAIGQLSFVLSVLLRQFGSHIFPAQGVNDFMQGFFAGLAIVFNLVFLVWYRTTENSKVGGISQ